MSASKLQEPSFTNSTDTILFMLCSTIICYAESVDGTYRFLPRDALLHQLLVLLCSFVVMGNLLQVSCLHEELGVTWSHDQPYSSYTVYDEHINNTIKGSSCEEKKHCTLPTVYPAKPFPPFTTSPSQPSLTLYLADGLLEWRKFRLVSWWRRDTGLSIWGQSALISEARTKEKR